MTDIMKGTMKEKEKKIEKGIDIKMIKIIIIKKIMKITDIQIKEKIMIMMIEEINIIKIIKINQTQILDQVVNISILIQEIIIPDQDQGLERILIIIIKTEIKIM